MQAVSWWCAPGLSSMTEAVCCLQGVIVYFRVTDGELNVGDRVMLMNTRKEHIIDELGVLAPKPVNVRFAPAFSEVSYVQCLQQLMYSRKLRCDKLRLPFRAADKCVPPVGISSWTLLPACSCPMGNFASYAFRCR